DDPRGKGVLAEHEEHDRQSHEDRDVPQDDDGRRDGGPAEAAVERRHEQEREEEEAREPLDDALATPLLRARARSQACLDKRGIRAQEIGGDEHRRRSEDEQEAPALPVLERPRAGEEDDRHRDEELRESAEGSGGEGGIRTHEAFAYRFSRAAPSTTRTPLRCKSKLRSSVKRFHYAWVVVAVTFLALLAAQAVRAAPGVIITSLESEFGWSRTAISFAISLSILTFGLGGPLGGTLID